jgi:hypothetical protein
VKPANRIFAACAIGAAVALAAGALFFSKGKSNFAPSKTGTGFMVQLLKEKEAAEDPRSDFMVNKKRVALFKRKLAQTEDRGEILNLRLKLALETLYSGDVKDSIEHWHYLLKEMKREEYQLIHHPFLGRRQVSLNGQMWYFLGLAHFRLGEINNCVDHHNERSCVFPIEGHGIHRDKKNSEKAVKIWGEILDKHSDNDRVRWMLNIAYMTLGKYPGGVPKQYLIPPAAFKSEREFPAFRDIGMESGLHSVTSGAGSALMDDFRNAGVMDLFLSSPRLLDQLHYFKNNGKTGEDFAFVDSTKESGLTGITEGKNVVQGDYDNDGCLDLFLVRGAYRADNGQFPNSLLRGRCDGTFEDVTDKAGLLRFEPTYTAAWWDYDNDGWLDLIVPNESAPPFDFFSMNLRITPRGIELWHNNKDGTFTEVSSKSGLNFNGNYKGVLFGDYDNDGFGDIMLGETEGESRLLRNEGKPAAGGGWTFADVTEKAGLPRDLRGRTLMFLDFDNDGDQDLFASYGQAPEPISHKDMIDSYLGKPVTKHPRFFRNEGNGTFHEITKEAGLARAIPVMGANFGDLDYDGYPDLYLGTGATEFDQLTPNRMFWNKAGTKFLDVTTASKTGHLQKGHGVSFADLDRDGALDFIAQQGGGYEGDYYWTSIYKNPGFGNSWIQIKVKGVQSNRAGIGARIKLLVKENGKERSIYRTVNSGGSRGANPLVQYIGIGKATVIERLEVFWPASKKTTVLSAVKPNQWLEIDEK